MSEALFEVVIPLVADREERVLDMESAVWVLTQLTPPNLRRPPRQILAVEERDPVVGRGPAGNSGEQDGPRGPRPDPRAVQRRTAVRSRMIRRSSVALPAASSSLHISSIAC